jgi:hypothetical protein
MDYPAPLHACYLWTAGDVLWLAFPASADGTKGHAVHFPNDSWGWLAAKKYCEDRERVLTPKTIGTKGVPAQADANALLRAMKSAQAQTKVIKQLNRPKEVTLESLGLL